MYSVAAYEAATASCRRLVTAVSLAAIACFVVYFFLESKWEEGRQNRDHAVWNYATAALLIVGVLVTAVYHGLATLAHPAAADSATVTSLMRVYWAMAASSVLAAKITSAVL
jgi:succinate dehydrogenase hydrophobic anchor subunit